MAEATYQQAFERGVESFKQGQYEQSLLLFTDLIRQNPQRFAPFLNRGTIYLRLSLLSQALADFNRSIELDPRDPSPYFNRAIVRLKENQPIEALSDLYITLSCLYLQKGQQNREIKYITRAISLVENNVYAHVERGKLYKIQGNALLAENDFSSAIELNPRYSEAYGFRGSLYRDLKREENAARDLARVLALSTDRATSAFKLDPRLKPMNDAVLHQEILVKLREISEMRVGLSISHAQRSQSLIQEPIIQQPITVVVDSKESIEVIGADTKKGANDTDLKQQSSSEQLLISDFPEKQDTPSNADDSLSKPAGDGSISKADDSYATENKLGKLEVEIEQLRKEMIEEGNTSAVFNSRLDETPPNLSTSLDKSVDGSSIKQSIQHTEHATHTVTTLTSKVSNDSQEKKEIAKTTLQIEIVAANLTHDTEFLGRMSPFVSVTFAGETKNTPVIDKGGKNPVWNHKIYFPLKFAETQAKVAVWDKETLKTDDFVGQGVFPINESCTKCTLQFEGAIAGTVYLRIRLL